MSEVQHGTLIQHDSQVIATTNTRPEFIYKIIVSTPTDGETETSEYYTLLQPVILQDKLKLATTIEKYSVHKNILDQIVYEYYKENGSDEREFDLLYHSVEISYHSLVELVDKGEDFLWFYSTKEEAETRLKDKVLEYYQSIVPELLNTVKTLKTKIDTLTNREKQPQQRSQQEAQRIQEKNNILQPPKQNKGLSTI